MKINIVYPEVAKNTFLDWCFAMQDCLKKLGHDTSVQNEINSNSADIEIILSYARFGRFEKKKKKRYIMIQSEQFPTYQSNTEWQIQWFNRMNSLIDLYDEVWDTFAPFHKDLYPKEKEVKYFELGYHDIFDHSYHNQEYEYDTSFFGFINDKRRNLFKKIGTLYTGSIRGQDRLNLIHSSKINLNIHFSESQLLESLRILYLACNKAFIITEEFIGNEDLKEFLIAGSYDELPELVSKYLKDDKSRIEIAQTCYSYFKEKRTMIRSIKKCL